MRARRARAKGSSRAARSAVLGCALSLLVACGGDDEPRTRSYRDIGNICLEATADGEMTFFVNIDPGDRCLNYCDEHVTSCRATLENGRVELTTLLESIDVSGGGDCPAACAGSSGSCTLEAVPPGEYQLGFASRADTATVPLDGRAPLFGDQECNPRGDSTIPDPFE